MKRSARDIVFGIRRFLENDNDILKPKQKQILKNIAQAFEECHRAVYVEAPTGFGKTVITSQLLRAINRRKKTPGILMITPTTKLVEDAKKKIDKFAPEVDTGMYYTYAKDNNSIIVSTYASFPKLAAEFADQIKLVILDEAHHILSANLLVHLQKFKKALWLGLTATPGYSTKKHLEQHFYAAHKTTIHDAIDSDLISGYRNVLVYAKAVNLDSVPLCRTGDFSASALERAINITTRNLAAVSFYRNSLNPETGLPLLGQNTIINCVSIDHARDVANLFCQNIPTQDIGSRTPCAAIHGDMYRHDIQRILDAHRNGEIACLAQAKLIGEGYDDAGVKLVLNLKPSLSIIEVPQRGGRALRFDPNDTEATAIIVDFVDEGTLGHKLPLLFAEITGYSTYNKWKSTRIKCAKYTDIFTDDCALPSTQNGTSQKQHKYASIPGIEVVWSCEQVAEIVRKRHATRVSYNTRSSEASLPPKDVNWISAEEIANHFGVPHLLVFRVLRRCKPQKDRSDVRTDPQNNAIWRIESRRNGQIPMSCLHIDDLESFGNRYRLSIPLKTEDWLTIGEIAGMLANEGKRQVDSNVIAYIFSRLKLVSGKEDCRCDPCGFMEWRVSKRRHMMKVVKCLHQDDVDAFCKFYHLDAPECSWDFLSPAEIETRTERVASIDQRRVRKYLEACLKGDNPMGKQLSFAIEYRCVSGWPLPCLRRNALDAYMAFQRVETTKREAERLAYTLEQREIRRKERMAKAADTNRC